MCHFLVKLSYLVLAFSNYILFSTHLYYELNSWSKSLCTAVYGGVMINGFGLFISFLFRQRSYIMEISWSAAGAALYPLAGALNLFHYEKVDPIARLVTAKARSTCGPIALVCGALLAVDLVYNILERKWAIEDEIYSKRVSSIHPTKEDEEENTKATKVSIKEG